MTFAAARHGVPDYAMAHRQPAGDRGRAAADNGPVTGLTADPPFLDVADPAFSLRSAAVRRARETGWYARTSYGLAVLRYDQVSRLIRHPDLRQGSLAWPAHHGITSGPFADWWAGWVLNKEGEDHQRLRRLLNPAFSRRLVDAVAPRFLALATELIDAFAAAGRCEFMAEFAEPYAARVIAILLGIPEGEWRLLAADSATVGLAMGVRIRADLPRIEAALANLFGYADALIAARRRSPRDDFVTRLVEAQAGAERLTTKELRDSLVLLIFGGPDSGGCWPSASTWGRPPSRRSCGSVPRQPGLPGRPCATSPSTGLTSVQAPPSTCTARQREPTRWPSRMGTLTSRQPAGRRISPSAAAYSLLSRPPGGAG